MALGGGTWQAQNKILPGSYINFSSVVHASAALSDRGIVAAPLTLSWGAEGTVIELDAGDVQKNCKVLFGYSYESNEMLALRELFCHARKAFVYRLGTGAVKASCTYAQARYGGARGNSITIAIAANADDNTKFDVSTYFGGEFVDKQTVSSAAGLTDNDYVTFITSATLAVTAGVNLSGGTDATVNGAAHEAFLAKIESYAFNVLCCPASESATVALYKAFTQRLRDELGIKFQLVTWQAASDYEGVIGVWNTVTHSRIVGVSSHLLVYWVAGAEASAAFNKSLTNAVYDGELTVDTAYTQAQLEAAIQAGKFMLHNVSGTVRVLIDVNSLVTLSDEKGAVFQSNQTIRVCDQIANDIATLFASRYAGVVANDASGRAALWGDVTKLLRDMERVRAIEAFDTEIVSVEPGDDKRSVLITVNGLNVINAMEKLYMSVIVM